MTMFSTQILKFLRASFTFCLIKISFVEKMDATSDIFRSVKYTKIEANELMNKTNGSIYCKSLPFENMFSTAGNNKLKCITQAQTTLQWIVASNSSHCLACYYDEVSSEYKRFEGDLGSLVWVKKPG